MFVPLPSSGPETEYWLGQKVCLDFSMGCYGKTQMNFLANPINTHWMGCYPGYGSMTKIILLKGKKRLFSSILESSICTEKKKRTWHPYIPRSLGKWYTWRIYLIFQTTGHVFTTAHSSPTAFSSLSFDEALLLPTGPWTLLASKPEQALQHSSFSLSGKWADQLDTVTVRPQHSCTLPHPPSNCYKGLLTPPIKERPF